MIDPRPFCYRCHKAASVCICDEIPEIENRTGIVVLQHAGERRHPIGTVRILRLALERVRIETVPQDPPGGRDEPLELPAGTALLFPSEEARNLASLSPEERPDHLLVLDGTWRQVRALRRRNPWLTELPAVEIETDRRSRYRIRKAPQAGFLSTVEAVHAALAILEPETQGLDELLEVFEAMIDEQVRRMPKEHRRRSGLE